MEKRYINSIFMPIFLMLMSTLSTQNLYCQLLFESSPNSQLYWQALVQIAKNNKQGALDLVAKIQEPGTDSYEQFDTNDNGIESLFDDFFVSMVSQAPQTLSELGLFESIGIREHNAFLNDVSPEAMLRALSSQKQFFQRLQNYNPTALSGDMRRSYDLVEWELSHAVDGERFLFHDYRISQLSGILSNLTMLMTQFHRLEIAQDVDHYLARLRAVPLQLYQAMSLLQQQERMGIVAPTFTLEKVIAITQSLIPDTVSDNIFYNYLAQHITSIGDVDNDAVLAQAHEIIANQIYPACRALQDFLAYQRATYPSNDGVWALPDGDKYYDYMLKHHTTTDLTADEIHQLGLQEVARIQEQMRMIFASEGIVDDTKTVGQMVQQLGANEQFFYPQTDEGSKQCLADFEAILQRCRKELYPLFDLKPNAPVKVLPVPAHDQDGAPAAYYFSPSLDGSRPGSFFVNLRDMKEVPKYGMETLAVHEAEPGHHFQIALQIETDMHIVRKMSAVTISYNAYLEGWALYTERLAYEQGFYSSSWSKLGHLQDELLRAVRLVVDTGIHKKRWSKDFAVDYMEQVTGYHRNSVITEVERYFVLPGQACSYKIGQIKILELRKRARDTLGSNFDIRDFHNVVLALGAVPLALLERAIDEYICEKTSLLN